MTSAVLRLDGMNVPLETAGPSRKARLTIERDGSLTLRAAEDIDRAELESFIVAKRAWIYKKLAEKEALHYEPVTKELVDGEGFLYLGRSHRLLIARTDDRHVSLQRGRLVLPATLVGDGHAAFIRWYRSRGKTWLQPRVTDWAQRLRVNVTAFEVAELGYRWGAAEPTGRVRINWATMQLRPSLVEYVLAHELAHLKEPHHGPSFWNLLARVQPDYIERRTELARVGASIWIGANE
ncbi:MAG TPA: SprT family zinc-dependent metalloprotease [Candidatus Dormibacteraeota bacterium]|jgi:predicted metal-dependent hydrolase